MTSLSYLLHLAVFFLYVTNIIVAAAAVMDNEIGKYEEYIIEHEISATQAKNSALTSDINAIIVPAGCQECTKEEKHYCTSSDFISDHCCCDRRFHEYLPYIPHTCYFGPQVCNTVLSDCTKYTRLRTCCCDRYLLQKWKEKYNHNSAETTKNQNAAALLLLLLLFLSVVHIFV